MRLLRNKAKKNSLKKEKRRQSDEGPHIGPLTRVMARTIEEGEGLQKTLLLEFSLYFLLRIVKCIGGGVEYFV